MLRRSAPLLLLLGSTLGLAGCARLGDLGSGERRALAEDTAALPPDDPSGPGQHPVEARGILDSGGKPRFPFALYRPADVHGPAPAVVILPGLLAPESQYESYARALASRGFVVAVRGAYGPFKGDQDLAKDASRLADWLARHGLADPRRLGVAGHSRGAKDAILAAVQDPRFQAVVALEPDDQGELSVIRDALPRLGRPLLLVGAEWGWKGLQVCAPRETNYQRFFERAPPGTVELELLAADHVQVMDDPEALGMFVCRRGTADSRTVRRLARGATVSFFAQHLLGGPPAALSSSAEATVRVRGASGQ